MDQGDRLRQYHQRTKHSVESIRTGGHSLDWDNEPSRFKRYLDVSASPLPSFGDSGVAAHVAVTASARPDGKRPLDPEVLSHLLFHAGGVTRTVPTAVGEFHFRTYASAGALYPIELYVVAGMVDGLDPGVYHYAPREHGLHRLRRGDMRGGLGLAGASPGTACVVMSGVPWRTAWKYGARGFRHLSWDAGTMLANLLAAAAAEGIRSRVLLGYVDEDVGAVLGIDGRTEFAVCLIALGRGEDPPATTRVEAADLRVAPLGPRPGSDPQIEGAREAVRLRTEDEVRTFREARAQAPAEAAPVIRPDPPGEAALSEDPLERVVRRRGSSRRLAGRGMPAAEYAAIVDGALSGLPADWHSPGPRAFVSAHALEGLPRGAYEYLPGSGFRPIVEGPFRTRVGHLCLDQRLGADAAATTFFMADLDEYLGSLGGRGYVAAQLEAAVAAGRMYLGGYAQCLGASGITFFDDEARAFFRTEAEPMLAVVLGPEGRRRDLIECRRDRGGS